MALNIISNFAANVAHRNLTASDAEATSSVAKLSAGKRVLAAKDDAASLAIGSRLSAEVAGLKQAGVNAGQASSMLQIADGAMDKVNDILTRMKTLSVQSGSGQLSDTERGMLDTEFQSLKGEIDRIAEDTEFNGTQLVAGDVGATVNGASTGIEGVTLRGFDFSAATAATTADLVFTATGEEFSIEIDDGNGTATFTGSIAEADQSDGGTSMDATTVVELTSTSHDGTVLVSVGRDFDPATGDASAAEVTVAAGATDQLSLDFKVGTGTNIQSDQINVSVGSLSTSSLGIAGDDISSQDNADIASSNISAAIDALQTERANIGASQNRLDFAAANIATSQENQEAARSQLMDLDVAAEMSKFTSKQILVQAGTSMLAQANQLPQNLLSLFR
jgi:flagellin